MSLAERVQKIQTFGRLIMDVTFGDYATYRVSCFIREGKIPSANKDSKWVWDREKCENHAKAEVKSFYQVPPKFDGFNDRAQALQTMGLSIDEYYSQLKAFEQELTELYANAEAIYPAENFCHLLDYGEQHVFFGTDCVVHLD